MRPEEKKQAQEAGKICAEARAFAEEVVEKGKPLVHIAEAIEAKIYELGGEPAFPVNLSINEIAAHYTPTHDDETTAQGILKVDFGVHVNGWIADNAFSVDLENNHLNKKLIEGVKNGLNNAIETTKYGCTTHDIGKEIQRTLLSENIHPIVNLSGHSMDQYDLHAGITIPNIGDNSTQEITEGLYAIEPFGTFGSGKVRDGKPSSIYLLLTSKNVRSPIAREVLTHITENFGTLPFCSRWIVKVLGTKALVGLRQLEENGNLHQYAQLIEASGAKVAQWEHTLLVTPKETITTTKDHKSQPKENQTEAESGQPKTDAAQKEEKSDDQKKTKTTPDQNTQEEKYPS